MKYKKHISIFLIFIVCTTFIYRPKNAQAFDFVVTPTILWSLGTLVLGTGIVALNHQQITDMGKMVFDDLKLKGLNETDIFDKIIDGIPVGIKVGQSLINSVSFVANKVSGLVDDYFFETPVSSSRISFGKPSYFPLINKQYSLNPSQVNVISIFKPYSNFNYYLGGRYYSDAKPHSNSGVYRVLISYTLKNIEYVAIGDYFSTSNSIDVVSRSAISDFKELYVEGNIGYFEYIPYSNPSISEGYNEGFLPQALPYTDSKPGYIPIPSVIPMDTPITTELPLTWDSVKDKVIDLPVDGTTDIPGVGELDKPGDTTLPGELSLWEWLKNLLNSILNAIKSILSFLTGFLVSLLNGIKDLLLSLFIPSDTYFTDTFDRLKNQFSNKLSYNSYSDLFNRQYAASGIKDITINWQGQNIVIVKFTEYLNFKSFVDTVAYAFFFFLLAMYNYNQIYKLIRGTDLVGSGNTIGHMHGQLSASEELRANNMEKAFKKLGR